MRTIYDSTRKVKPASRRPFAAGLARPNRERTAPYTTADLAYASVALNATCRDYEVVGPADALIDQLAGETSAVALMELNVRPF